ncbi:MAG: hypothetical protein DDG60_15680 [Anaerolineae bacterium]|nr:MAG: hypothetical protein DDG60_15680 [Anaerolineae bacterium]
MNTQVFFHPGAFWRVLSVMLMLVLILTPFEMTEANALIASSFQPVNSENQEIGGQGEEGSSYPVYRQTSAFLAGRVAVGVVAIESSTVSIPNQENWTSGELQKVRDEVWTGLQKWVSWKPANTPLEFVVDITRDGMADNMASDSILPIQIADEPIVYDSGTYGIWTRTALVAMGYSAGSSADDAAYQYAAALRAANNADWAFVLFVIDSSNDNDTTPGAFTDGVYLRARTFGPLAVMTYNNGTRGADNMEWTTAQLVARMFGAGFQYLDPVFEPLGCSSTTKKFGYWGIANAYCGVAAPSGEPNPRLMYHGNGNPDSTTLRQVGWIDTDSDGIIDLLDNRPSILFSPYPINPTIDNPLTYSEAGTRKYRAFETPVSSATCLTRPTDECFYSYYYDITPDNLAVTINKIQSVEYRIDGGAWNNATLTGSDPDYKIYSFTTPTLTGGKRKIEVRAQNSVGAYSFTRSNLVTIADPPLNDLFDNRIIINSLPYDHAVDTAAIPIENEDDPSDPLPLSSTCTNTRKGKRSVWYQYTSTSDKEIYLDTFGTDYTTVLSVWRDTGSNSIDDAELVICADSSTNDHVNVSFTPTAGMTYYFMISEFNTASGSMEGAQDDVSGQGGGTLIFQVSEIKNPAYLPMLFKNAFGGNYNSAFYVQNVSSTTPTKVNIKFYDTDGNLSCSISEMIAPLASQGWWLPSMGCLPASWVGGAYITSVQPIIAVGRPHIASEVMTYTGFSTGAKEMYLPMLFKNAFGGAYKSAFYVQNVDPTNIANISVEFYDQNGVSIYTVNDTINPLASKGWWLPSLSSLPDNWVGSAVVRSNRDIVTVGRPHAGSEVMTYNGFISGNTTSYLPMLFKNAFTGGTYKSAFYIQNVDDWNSANVTIRYYNDAGTLNCTIIETIAPMASRGYWLPSVGCLPDGWIGGVEVTSNRSVVLVGRPHIDTQITTYNGFSDGSTVSFVPMLFKNAFGGTYKSAFYIQNLSSTASANITIKYYNNLGTLGCSVTDTIPRLASKGYWLPSVTCLLNGWVGGVVITSNEPIVTVGRPHIGTQVTTYAGFSSGSENP